MDTLLAKLSEQQALLEKQKNALTPTTDEEGQQQTGDSSSSSVLLTPATDSFSVTGSGEGRGDDDTIQLDVTEMSRLKKELDAAKNQIARQKQELDQTRGNIQTHDPPAGFSSQRNLDMKIEGGNRTSAIGLGSFNPVRSIGTRHNHWPLNEDARSDSSDAISAGVFNTPQTIWSAPTRPAFGATATVPNNQHFQQPMSTWGQPGARPWAHRAAGAALPSLIVPPQQHLQQRIYSGPASPISSTDGRLANDYNQFPSGGGLRRSSTQSGRSSSVYPHQRNSGWDMFPGGVSPMEGVNLGINTTSAFQSMGLYPAAAQYQPRPIGTPLSPTAEEFRTAQASGTPWNAAVSSLCLLLK